ncbi:MAG: signal recognition particle-docking protein FtsY [Chitinivibrionales bacterium]|nr:signal recognition particle-docking protein FtsY [Chitinivibrionales bacterium]
MNFLERLKDGLKKTRYQMASMIGGAKQFDETFFGSLEDALIAADIGLELSLDIIVRLKSAMALQNAQTPQQVYALLKKIVAGDLAVTAPVVAPFTQKPWVMLFVGVNGTGKTTTIGKMASAFKDDGKKTMLVAADTFRAGAIEQLQIWADRSNSDFIAQHEGADAASVAYDALEAAKARTIDVVLLDTAGRLHTKVNLMNEMEKIVRVVGRAIPGAPHETLLVIDGTTGQNALKQAQVFHDVVGLTGLIITKLDGTAKGGIALALTKMLNVPIKKIGIGEDMSDLQDFDPAAFAESMFGDLPE